jgi:hypothetical protein
MNQELIFEVFFQRAYELGTVSKQDYREYKLQKIRYIIYCLLSHIYIYH